MKMPETVIAGLIATEFDDPQTGREMRYIHDSNEHALAGYIVWKHNDGQWVTLRKATEADMLMVDNAERINFQRTFQ